MERTYVSCLVFVVVCVLVGVAWPTSAGDKEVIVTNAETAPVPIAGEVGVSTSASAPLIVRDAGAIDRVLVSYPFNVEMTDREHFPEIDGCDDSEFFLEVRQNHYFALESVNVQAESEIGEISVGLYSTLPGEDPCLVDDAISVPVQSQGGGVFSGFVAGRWYVPAGFKIRPAVRHIGGEGMAHARIVVVGHFERGCPQILGTEHVPGYCN